MLSTVLLRGRRELGIPASQASMALILHQLALGLAVAVCQLLVQLMHLEQVDHKVVGDAGQQHLFGIVGQPQPVGRVLFRQGLHQGKELIPPNP